MSMPEAAVDEDYQSVLGQNDIRRAWQAPLMQAEAKALTMKPTAKLNFWLCVPALDARHHL